MPDRWEHQDAAGGNERPRPTSARAAAEALFAPKRPVAEPPAAENSTPADPAAHKPRVLSITPSPAASREKTEPAPRPEPQTATPAIPASQVASIRAWVKYGMTVQQVAEVTGVAPGEIERILRSG